MTLKEKYKRVHLLLAEWWEIGKWDFSMNKWDCPMCGFIKKAFFESVKHVSIKDLCLHCTQHDHGLRCTEMRTYPGHHLKNSVDLPRAEYHLRMARFIETQPPERFWKKNIIQGFPEAFEIDKEVAKGIK